MNDEVLDWLFSDLDELIDFKYDKEVEALCKQYGRNYYIKEDLRREMEKGE